MRKTKKFKINKSFIVLLIGSLFLVSISLNFFLNDKITSLEESFIIEKEDIEKRNNELILLKDNEITTLCESLDKLKEVNEELNNSLNIMKTEYEQLKEKVTEFEIRINELQENINTLN